MTLKEFLEMKAYACPYTEEDLIEAFNLGRHLTLSGIRDKMIGLPVNGLCRNVLTEERLKEIQDGNQD